MKKYCLILLLAFLVTGLTGVAYATNGDNLIGIGAISRSMGGVGIAAPQDAISAVFANPAAMCFGPYCPGSQFDFDGTMFMPKVSAKTTSVDMTTGNPLTSTADSDDKVYAIPAIGISTPINKNLRFGLAAYGVSGLGVDYRDVNLNFFGQPTNLYTQLQIMKFSPNIAYMVNDQLSLGLGIHIDFSSLDLGQGSSFNYGLGAQLGAIYKPMDSVSLGLTYVTPQPVDHQNVYDFDGNGTKEDLELASPQQVGFGIAFEPIMGTLLIEGDVRWVNWANADGYEDFDWDNQWVYAIGAQYKPVKNVALRVGYNYGKNPVKEHNNFDAATFTNVQGTDVSTLNYEMLRIVGFPAVVEQHITLGIGYEVSKSFALNLGYKHAFEKTIKESGSYYGIPVAFESTLSEDAVDLGLTWRF